MAFINVDLPAPFAPITPRTVPWVTSKETPLSASIATVVFWRRPILVKASLIFGFLEIFVLYESETF
jgi:hypothetical protein